MVPDLIRAQQGAKRRASAPPWCHLSVVVAMVRPEYLRWEEIDPGAIVDTRQIGDAHIAQFNYANGRGLIGYGLLYPLPDPFPHVTEATFILGRRARGAGHGLYYAVRESMIAVADAKGFSRVQCHVDAANIVHRRFAERLGFRYEGLLQGFGPGKSDMFIMRMEG